MMARRWRELVCKSWDESRKLPVGGRLAWYTGHSSVDLWTDHWGKVDVRALLTKARARDYPYRGLFRRLLPKAKPVLEAGCGPGHIVLGLQQDGYQAIGIEWSDRVVQQVKALAPDCDIRQGDVLRLPFPDGYAGGYLSLSAMSSCSSRARPSDV